ncbi:MAG: hypothetical protein WB626_08585, partial [Bacteroidota bacterium]
MKRGLLASAALVVLLAVLSGSCSKDESAPVSPPAAPPSLGAVSATPGGIIVNRATVVLVRLTVPAQLRVLDTLIRLERLDQNGVPIDTLALLYDDGGLATHGDEIAGDKIYGNYVQLLESTPGQIRLRAAAAVLQGAAPVLSVSALTVVTVYSDFTTQEFGAIAATQEAARTRLNTDLGGNPANLPAAMAQLETWLQSQPGVQTVTRNGNTSIGILYASGVYGGIVASRADAGGTVLTRGGSA